MKILLLNYEFPPLGGGAATATENLLRQLSKATDIEVDLVTSSADKFKKEQFSQNIKVFRLNIGKDNKLHGQSIKDLLTYSWKAFWFCCKLKKKNKYDLIHAFFGIPCGFMAMFLGIPYVVSLRGSDVPSYSKKYWLLDKLLFWWISRVVWWRAKAVVANSKGLKELALKTAPKQEIGIICNGVDIEKFKPGEGESDSFTVVSTSRLIERKGINYLVDGFLSFSKEKDDCQLVLVGDGDQQESLEEKVKKNNAESKVDFVGAVSRDEIPIFYKKADVFVLPAINEAMSNSLLEAMASGLAIIMTDTGGKEELIDEHNGIIVKKRNSQDIEKALEKLYNDRDLLDKMKEKSREKAEKMSWEQMAGDYLEIYRKMINH